MRNPRSTREQGAALVTVLFLMLAVLMMSASSTRASLAAVKSARYERDRHIAHQSAEVALYDAERDIAGAAGPASPRTAIFVAADTGAFITGCAGAGEHAGLCRLVPAPGVPAWQALDLAGPLSVEYGRFTGATLPTGAGLLPSRPPRYIVELLEHPGADPVYRITAIGFGASDATRVVLQSYYRRANATAPAKRLGWREVANWPELHAATF
ncbi:PilX N-terminal domain-containing pilus assembly protein [Massilia sp. YIM B02769]|uniref:pilus assembly PilX family protein n=1 Tax=Massilia sp. YIM B02769 TaxID=3050129 RepID=UPI0025B67014|nr:PilX N-terminal domain-containing pilus assembly protein [Massilia sp. YIM B02769]MDN4060432.1 PilX N-terminal domain-containing pilus assembly protein [Massilia sp. YIM B02769]